MVSLPLTFEAMLLCCEKRQDQIRNKMEEQQWKHTNLRGCRLTPQSWRAWPPETFIEWIGMPGGGSCKDEHFIISNSPSNLFLSFSASRKNIFLPHILPKFFFIIEIGSAVEQVFFQLDQLFPHWLWSTARARLTLICPIREGQVCQTDVD